MDINPSIELKVNALDRVIDLKGRNADGEAVAQMLDVSGMAYDEAMQRILISEELSPYLEAGNMISISMVGGGSDAHAVEMLSKVVCRAYAIAEDENVFYIWQFKFEDVNNYNSIKLVKSGRYRIKN